MLNPKESEQPEGTTFVGPAELEDAEKIAEIYAQLHINHPNFKEGDQWNGKEWISEEIQNGNFFVFKKDCVVCGAMSIEITKKTLEINTLAVDKWKQKMGIGRELVEFAREQALQWNLKKIKVGSFKLFDARDFYLKCGFEMAKPPIESHRGLEYYSFIKRL